MISLSELQMAEGEVSVVNGERIYEISRGEVRRFELGVS
jgi:hypothetical protein